MCGRFAITTSWDRLRKLIGGTYTGPVAEILPTFNLCPTQMAPVLKSDHSLEIMRWGIPAPWEVKKGKEPWKARPLINAQSEKVGKWPWISHYKRRRGILPVTDWYEWLRVEKKRYPVRHSPAEGEILGLGVIWGTTDEVPCLSILTTPAGPAAARVHGRMPLVVPQPDWSRWLEEEDPSDLLQPAADEAYVMREANTAVNANTGHGPEMHKANWSFQEITGEPL